MAKKATKAKKTVPVVSEYTRIYSPIKSHGGKFYLTAKQLEYMPPRDSYDNFVDGCVGSGTVVLSHNPDGKSEIINDLDGIIYNFWKVIQDSLTYHLFKEMVEKTPFDEREYIKAHDLLASHRRVTVEPVLLAWALFVVVRQSRQALGKEYSTIVKNRCRRRMNENVSAWLTAIDGLDDVHDRVSRFMVHNKPVVQLLKTFRNVPRTFVYLDPPYYTGTRVSKDAYRYEMTTEQHQELLTELSLAEYKFMICGYPCWLYEEFAKKNNWRSVVFPTDNKASSAKVKEIKDDTIWMNY